MNRRAALASLMCSACDGGLPPCEGDEFVGMQSDFEDYERWHRFELVSSDPRLGEGPRFHYADALVVAHVVETGGDYVVKLGVDRRASNPVSNAVAHGCSGASVTVRVYVDAPEAVVEVHNLGEPVPEEVREHLFEPFRGTGGSNGLGLGLFIAHALVRAHGGTLGMQSSRDSGTTFTVRLPLGKE